jgi:hypothetical protein
MSAERLLGYCWACGIYEKDGSSNLSDFDIHRLGVYIDMHPNFEPPTPLPANGYIGRLFLIQEDSNPRAIFVMARIESPECSAIGHLRRRLEAGESSWGYSFEELWCLGSGGYILNSKFKGSAGLSE